MHTKLLAEPRTTGLTAPMSAPSRGDHFGPSPVDRARPGSPHHLIVDRRGTQPAVSVTGGNRHDVTQLIPPLEADIGDTYNRRPRIDRAGGVWPAGMTSAAMWTPRLARTRGSDCNGITRLVLSREGPWRYSR